MIKIKVELRYLIKPEKLTQASTLEERILLANMN